MTDAQPAFIHSRDNPLLKDLRRLAQDSTAYRKQGRVWAEGDHLCRAALQRGQQATHAVFQASYWDSAGHQWPQAGGRTVVCKRNTLVDLELVGDALTGSYTRENAQDCVAKGCSVTFAVEGKRL